MTQVEKPTPQVALQTLNEVASKFQGTRADIYLIDACIEVLAETINENLQLKSLVASQNQQAPAKTE